ncbi:MAG: hypothetical protein MUO26_05345 [Methanotrichaceae archaeon]|nr:hypothetical protein [Methanotrichaceae archaeon]
MIEIKPLSKTPFEKIHDAYKKNLETAENELKKLQAHQIELTELLAASQSYLQALQKGDLGDPQAHLTIKRYPEPPLTQGGRLATYWIALSGALLVLFIAALLLFLPQNLIILGVAVAGVFLAIESIARHRFISFLLSVTIALAIASSLILIWDFLWEILILGLIAIAMLSVVRNIRKLRGI